MKQSNREKIIACIGLLTAFLSVSFLSIALILRHESDKNYDYSKVQEITGTVIEIEPEKHIEKVEFLNGHIEEVESPCAFFHRSVFRDLFDSLFTTHKNIESDSYTHHVGDTVTVFTDTKAYTFYEEDLTNYSVNNKESIKTFFRLSVIVSFIGAFAVACLYFFQADEDEDDESSDTTPTVKAPMNGKVLAIKAEIGAYVKKGDVLCIFEALKLENEIIAPQDSFVQSISVSAGQNVKAGEKLMTLV